jgi:hypothetical protein
MVLPTATVGTGETFPITPQANVTVQGATAGTPTIIDVPAKTVGFTLASAGCGLSNLTIDGTNLTGNSGIQVTKGTPSITNVTVQKMGADGIDVSGGTLSIGSGASSNHNSGTGIYITAGKVIISVPAGDTGATFNNNNYGIVIKGTGSFTCGAATGQANPAATASSNNNAGLFIEQTPALPSSTYVPPANVLSNFLAGDNGANGIHIYGGSSLKLRDSVTQGNADNGIWISAYSASAGDAGSVTSNDLSNIDLGQTTDPGGNTFQFGAASSPNAGAGICLDLPATANQQLNAAGNIFEGVNCGTATTTLKSNATCTGAVDYSIYGTTDNSIVVATCK